MNTSRLGGRAKILYMTIPELKFVFLLFHFCGSREILVPFAMTCLVIEQAYSPHFLVSDCMPPRSHVYLELFVPRHIKVSFLPHWHLRGRSGSHAFPSESFSSTVPYQRETYTIHCCLLLACLITVYCESL